MGDFNRVVLVGNLTRDPELRYTPGGQPVCNLGLAINRTWKDKQDQKQKETTFLTVVVWGKTGENCGTHLKKGRQILVEGRLQMKSWEKDGEKRTSLDIVADNVTWLGGRDRGGAGAPAGDNAPPEGAEDDIPF